MGMAEETDWDRTRKAIDMLSDRWPVNDEFSARPEVATFAKAVLDQLQAKGTARPLLMTEGDGGIVFTFEEPEGPRYITFEKDSIDESVRTSAGWAEISYAEVDRPL
jgi:hypothetical protein